MRKRKNERIYEENERESLFPSLAYFRPATNVGQAAQFGGDEGIGVWLNKDKIGVGQMVS